MRVKRRDWLLAALLAVAVAAARTSASVTWGEKPPRPNGGGPG